MQKPSQDSKTHVQSLSLPCATWSLFFPLPALDSPFQAAVQLTTTPEAQVSLLLADSGPAQVAGEVPMYLRAVEAEHMAQNQVWEAVL